MGDGFFADTDWTNFIGLICIPLTMFAMKLWNRWSETSRKRDEALRKQGYEKALTEVAEQSELDQRKQLAVDVDKLKKIIKGELSDQSTDLKETNRVVSDKVADTLIQLTTKVEDLTRDKNETHTKLWEATHENHKATEDLRHATNNKLQAITYTLQDIKDGQKAQHEQLEKLDKWSAEHSEEDRENFAKVLSK